MKKLTGSALVFLLCLGILSGCGKSYDSEVSTVYILDKGNVVSTDVEDFDENVYSKEQLENYINDSITQYTTENGNKSVELKQLKVEENKAMLTMQYATVKDYTKFSGIELFSGNIADAQAAGYSFDQSFATVENGKAIGSVNASAFLNNDNLKVVVIKGNVNVQVEGTILYATTENVSVVDNSTVSIKSGQALLDGNNKKEQETEAVEAGTEELEPTEMLEDEVTMSETEQDIEFEFDKEISVDTGSDEFSSVYAYIIYK